VESRSVTREDTWRLRTDIGSFEGKMTTKEDLRCVEDKMAAENQVEALAISVEESGLDMVQHFLSIGGVNALWKRFRVDSGCRSYLLQRKRNQR